MTEPTKEEIESSINLLTAYRDRLTKEVLDLAKKLRVSQQTINQTLANHSELSNVKDIISDLNKKKQLIENNF